MQTKLNELMSYLPEFMVSFCWGNMRICYPKRECVVNKVLPNFAVRDELVAEVSRILVVVDEEFRAGTGWEAGSHYL